MASVCICIRGRGLVYTVLLCTMLFCTIDVICNNHPHLCVCMSKLWQHIKHYPLTCIYIWSPKYYEYQLKEKEKHNYEISHVTILYFPFLSMYCIYYVCIVSKCYYIGKNTYTYIMTLLTFFYLGQLW